MTSKASAHGRRALPGDTAKDHAVGNGCHLQPKTSDLPDGENLATEEEDLQNAGRMDPRPSAGDRLNEEAKTQHKTLA